jgi:hypothetical protein
VYFHIAIKKCTPLKKQSKMKEHSLILIGNTLFDVEVSMLLIKVQGTRAPTDDDCHFNISHILRRSWTLSYRDRFRYR